MRLLERTLTWVEIAPRAVYEDALGGVIEGFSEERFSVRASIIPSTGGLQDHETGVQQVQTMCMLVPKDVPVAVGDGVFAEDALWRCTEVQRWSAHWAVKMSRVRGMGQ